MFTTYWYRVHWARVAGIQLKFLKFHIFFRRYRASCILLILLIINEKLNHLKIKFFDYKFAKVQKRLNLIFKFDILMIEIRNQNRTNIFKSRMNKIYE